MRPRPSGASTGPTEGQKERIKMKIPNYYIDDLNDIMKSVDTLDAGGIFQAYQRLTFIKDMFEIWGVSLEDAIFDRLLQVKAHTECLLIKKLAEYEVLKMRVECYEGKS